MSSKPNGNPMTEANDAPKSSGPLSHASQSDFLSRALDRTPGFVLGFIGSALGCTLCFVAAMKLGGLDAPFSRIVNAYAASIESNMSRMDKSADRLDASVKSLETVQTSLSALAARVSTLETADVKRADVFADHTVRLRSAEERLTKIEGRIHRNWGPN